MTGEAELLRPLWLFLTLGAEALEERQKEEFCVGASTNKRGAV
jgi:hypothetical protein